MSRPGRTVARGFRLLRGNWQSALGILIAGVATGAITFGGYEYYRDNGSLQLDVPGVTVALLAWVAVGLASGFVSGRLRDAIGAWIAAMIGVAVAYVLFYVVLHPDVVFPVEGGFVGSLPSVALFLAGFLTFGHWLGSFARTWVEEGAADEPEPAGRVSRAPAPPGAVASLAPPGAVASPAPPAASEPDHATANGPDPKA